MLIEGLRVSTFSSATFITLILTAISSMPASGALSMENVLYDTPWVPIFNGKPLPGYPEYEALVAQKQRPDPSQHGNWARAKIVEHVDSVPEAENAFWECALALWRLSCLADVDLPDQWGLYVLAWLVSIRVLMSVLESRSIDDESSSDAATCAGRAV